MLAVIGAVVVFVAVNEVIFPVPLAIKPIAVLSLIQSKVAPAVGLEKLEVVVGAASQITILGGTITVGFGFTVIE